MTITRAQRDRLRELHEAEHERDEARTALDRVKKLHAP